MQMKKLVFGVVFGSMFFFFTACTPTSEKEITDTKSSTSEVSKNRTLPSKKELKEILEKTIPDTNNHFETNEEGLEAFVRYVEEFPPLIELSMIEKVREKGHLYFTEDQMLRLNQAFDDTTAL